MKNIEEEKLLDLFLLAYRLGEIKDMNNLLNSEMRERAKDTIEIYLNNKKEKYEKNNNDNALVTNISNCRRLNHLQSGQQVLIER